MDFQKIFQDLNPLYYCRKYGLSLWQCPQFLFLLMGVIIIGVILGTYFIVTLKIADPITVSLIVLLVGAVLLTISYTITRSIERMAEASQMKTEFINVVSHQLRSPLTNLKYSLEALLSGKLGKIEEEQMEYFKILTENCQRMGDLCKEDLEISGF
ncbi:MAG: histidine kinase dimerization/phospho-acceptor domain-containing protein [Patescibacteria group bacterium]|nr:histidine kinase dimerization/phospho-acceptor domain-containing protein [Patescibacteria group bacterium]